MAVAQLNLSRRALLGAAFAAPGLSAVEAPVLSAAGHAALGREGQGHIHGLTPSGPHQSTTLMGSSWDRAKARFGKAEAALIALAHTADEARYDRAGARHDAALQRLLRTPAPDAAALADKLDLLIAHRAWELTTGEACLAAFQQDTARLCRT